MNKTLVRTALTTDQTGRSVQLDYYLLSEYILFNNRIHPDDVAYTAFGGAFNRTEMFALLNGPFERIVISGKEEARLRERTYYGYAYEAETSFLEQAFTPEEAACLVTDEALGTVFLPSADDLKNPAYGFGSDEQRQAYGGVNAKHGA